MSAILNCSAWKAANGLPNCSRSFKYSRAVLRAACAVPNEQVAILIRPPSRPCIANLKPSPSWPSKLVAGILTPSKLIKRVGCAFQPIFSSALPYSIPAASAGTTNAEIPAAPSPPVRAITTSKSVSPAPEINILEPEITYSSPSFTALVFSDAASEPEPGSVKQ